MSVFTIAVAQATPVFLNREATIAKACALIAEAARQDARLILFPETFVPTYPLWTWVVPPRENRLLAALYAELVDQSVTIPSDGIATLCRAAREAGVHVVIGVNERNADASGASLFNTIVYIDAAGRILGTHRKLVPTAPERMIWSQGDGSTLAVYDTALGKLGGLICWENYMPLARYAMYAWGTQIYVAPTWDSGEPWLSTLRHIAKEGRVYVLGCCSPVRLDDIPDAYGFKRFYPHDTTWINDGDSAIVDPDGTLLAGPLHREEGLLYACIDRAQFAGPRWKLDVAGHYARPDVFELIVHREPHPIIKDHSQAAPIAIATGAPPEVE